MLLAFDIGNSNIVMGIFKGKELVASWRLSTDPKRTVDEYMVLLSSLLTMNNLNPKEARGSIIGSVVPHLSHIIKSVIKKLCDIESLVIDGGTPLPLKNLYDNPWEVGIDRLANAVGGKVRYGAPIIIVDFGTATTLDAVSKEGDYIGGVILPGAESSADVLFQKTALLPRVIIDDPQGAIGKTTRQSIRSGIIFGFSAAIDGLIDKFWEELGYSTEVVGTGGLSPTFSKHTKKIYHTDVDLTLFGLKTIWDYNND